MSQFTHTPAARRGQIHASTLFALTLALLGGLIGAYLFRTYVMNGKSTVAPTVAATPTFPITVAAVNLMEKSIILPSQVKIINVSQVEFEKLTTATDQQGKLRGYMRGQQPVNRVVTRGKFVRAEEPIYEDVLDKIAYPKPVSQFLQPGKRAIILEVPSKLVMVQVGDHVDVLCTLSNDAFGQGRTATAVLAKDLRVVARFGTTNVYGKPPPGDHTRTFTLEATPYQCELVELARSLNAVFTLSVSKWIEENPVNADMPVMADNVTAEHVTSADLARVFGITMTGPVAKAGQLEIRRFAGVREEKPLFFPVSTPFQPPPPAKPVAAGDDFRPMPGGIPGTDKTSAAPVTSDSLSDATSATNNSGFRPPPNSPAGGCKTCGKKKDQQ